MGDILDFDINCTLHDDTLYESNTVDLLNDVDHLMVLPEKRDGPVSDFALDPSHSPNLDLLSTQRTGSRQPYEGSYENSGNEEPLTTGLSTKSIAASAKNESSPTAIDGVYYAFPRRSNLSTPPLLTLKPAACGTCRSTTNTCSKALSEEAEKAAKKFPPSLDLTVPLEELDYDPQTNIHSTLSDLTSPCTPEFSANLSLTPEPNSPLYDTIPGLNEPICLEKLFDGSNKPSHHEKHSCTEKANESGVPFSCTDVRPLVPEKLMTAKEPFKERPRAPAANKGSTKRKPRTYAQAVPSQHCHICSRRPTDVSPHAVCGNLLRGRCRKTVCEKCFHQFGWDLRAARGPNKAEWLCPHCQGVCPRRAQCYIYDRTSARRREKKINHRKPKINGDAKSVGSTTGRGYKNSLKDYELKRGDAFKDEQKPRKRGRKSKKESLNIKKGEDAGQHASADFVATHGLVYNGQTISLEEAMSALQRVDTSEGFVSSELGERVEQETTDFRTSDLERSSMSRNLWADPTTKEISMEGALFGL